MLVGGDEMGRTQAGNNNAYCQDNEISWFDWESLDRGLLAFTQRLLCVRRDHPVFRRSRWFRGRSPRGADVGDIAWFRPDGESMSDEDWHSGFAKSFGVFLNGDGLRDLDENGNRLTDDSFLLLFNAHHEPLQFTIPPASFGDRWNVVIDTATEDGSSEASVAAGEQRDVIGRGVLVLSRPSQA
jgi:isoamylase